MTPIRAKSNPMSVNNRKIMRERLIRKNWRLALIGYLFGLATMSVYMKTQLQCYRVIVIDPEQARPMMVYDKYQNRPSSDCEGVVLDDAVRSCGKFDPIQAL